jgi:deoxyribodipyrimidine photo-lyase
MSTTPLHIVWFRQDLRLADNPALHAAAAGGGSVLPVYIDDHTDAGDWAPGSASRWWLEHSLAALNEALDGRLHVLAGSAGTLIPELVSETGAASIFWNRCVEPWRSSRDSAIKAELQSAGIEVNTFNGAFLYDPAEVTKRDGTPYRVFTPFYRHVSQNLEPREPLPAPSDLRLATDYESQFERVDPSPWPHDDACPWSPGESGAHAALETFLEHRIDDYPEARDRPDIDGVSRLSPHLHLGEISPHQVRRATLDREPPPKSESQEKFLTELGWREFSAHLLTHLPDLPERNVQKKFDRFPWQHDEALCDAWRDAQTGYPIVDAGLRELRQTGFMHNRVRMIVGSFLTKNLLQDWRVGERWFWENLVDADLANNSASWQWIAGCGADAAPYFRIFNPVMQGAKFDPNGDYVRRFVPELANMPNKYVHQPWEAPSEVLADANVQLGENYPSPIVDRAESREKALAAYKSLTQSVD